MADQLSAAFVSYASDILADTNLGLSGPQIVKITAGYPSSGMLRSRTKLIHSISLCPTSEPPCTRT